MSEIILKYFFMFICSLLFCMKIYNLNIKINNILIISIFSLIYSFIFYISKKYISTFSIMLYVFLVFIFIILIHRQCNSKLFFLSLISTTFSIIIMFIPLFITSAFVFYFFENIELVGNNGILDIAIFGISGVIQIIITVFFCKNKRLINGMKLLIENKNSDLFIYISFTILTLYSVFSYFNTGDLYYIIPFVSIVLLSVAIYFILKTSITRLYLESLKTKEFEEMKHQIERLKEDNEKMASQIHKDNKMIPVMQFAVMELIKYCQNDEKLISLKTTLEKLSQERKDLITQKISNIKTCGVLEIDAIFRYYEINAKENNINIEFDIDNIDIKTALVPDLSTIICDLCENAIIATKEEAIKHIRI